MSSPERCLRVFRWVLPGCGALLLGQFAPDAAKTKLVTGVVEDVLTGAVVPGVRVSVRGLSSAEATKSDSDGKFMFTEVPDGNWKFVTARTRGYLPGAVTASFRTGEKRDPLKIILKRAGVISGIATASEGTPVTAARVTARCYGYRYGRSTVVAHYTRKTDDLGRFLFEDLVPCRYVLAIEEATKRLRVFNKTEWDSASRYDKISAVSSLYLGAATPGEATYLTVGPGARLEGIQLPLRQARSFCVAALLDRVEDGALSPDDPVAVWLAESYSSGQSALANGLFHSGDVVGICGIAAGDYHFLAMVQKETKVWIGAVSFSVADRSVMLPSLLVQRSGQLEGAVAISDADRSQQKLRKEDESERDVVLHLDPTNRLSYVGEGTTVITQVGERFVSKWIAAGQSYWPNVAAVPRGYYVDRIVQGGIDTEWKPIRAGAGDVEIRISPDGGSVVGRATGRDGSGTPFAFVTIAQWPIPNDLGPGRIRTVETDASGYFVIQGLPPGAYRIIALTEMYPTERESPEIFLKSNVRGSSITVSASARVDAGNITVSDR